jgi:hypothetical protein
LRWLKRLDETERNVTILVTHDNERFEELIRKGDLGRI